MPLQNVGNHMRLQCPKPQDQNPKLYSQKYNTYMQNYQSENLKPRNIFKTVIELVCIVVNTR